MPLQGLLPRRDLECACLPKLKYMNLPMHTMPVCVQQHHDQIDYSMLQGSAQVGPTDGPQLVSTIEWAPLSRCSLGL